MKPVLLVTNYLPAFRVGAFAALHAREGIEVALIGGEVRHGGAVNTDTGGLITHAVAERDAYRLAASGAYRAVIAGMSGKLALPGAYLGARSARVPFVLWATIWAHPRTPAHALSYPPTRWLYRHADAIATYGPHVSAYVRGKGARGPIFEAPQAVDGAFWGAQVETPHREADYQVLFVGRPAREKGTAVLEDAWRQSGLHAPGTALVSVAGQGPLQVRNFYAGSDVVVLPSVPTRDFLEPWGLVINEAFHQGRPVIATKSVGAVAAGLVRHEHNGLVVAPNDPAALANALRRLHDDPALRGRLGAQARIDVAPYTQAAWAAGMSRALASTGASRQEVSLP